MVLLQTSIKLFSSLKSILANIYNNIYFNKELSGSMNIGILTLIYKNKGLNTDLKNWRPISLLNIEYKILTKILTNRLKNDANLLINSLQAVDLVLDLSLIML